MAEVPEEPDVEYVPELPGGVLVKIFSSLTPPNPHSVRDLCAAASVCPSWRDAAKELSLWRVLGVTKAPLNERLTGPRLRNLVARSHNTLTTLQLDGCPLLTDVMLSRILMQQPRLVYVRVKGSAHVTRPGLAYALCDAEDFQGVVALLNDPRQSVADAQRCCVALRMLLDGAKEKPATLAEAQAAGTLDALSRCAVLHVAHAGAQAACCFALSEYVLASKRTGVASYPPVFQAAVAALKAHPLDVNVQRAALLALLGTCISGLEGTPGVPALLDAIQPVLAAMRAFPINLNVQTYGCRSLTLMCKLNASVAEAVAAAGAMGLFIKALNLDLPVDTISAVEAIGAIALSAAALPQASAGVVAVVRFLRRRKKISGVVIFISACKTLGIYLRCPDTRERAVQAGAEAAIQEALAEDDDDDEVVLTAAVEALQAPQA